MPQAPGARQVIKMKNSATIFNMQRYSIHDGPGIRTLVFFKGCPLRCKWCANPEGISPEREVKYIKQKCNACAKCLDCPSSAVSFSDEDGFAIDRRKCTACGVCIESCTRKAKTWSGYEITLEELMAKIKRDAVYYKNSGGGVTLGGGAPLLKKEFAVELLTRCRQEGINTAVETEGYCDFETYRKCAGLCDTIFTDLKAIDTEKHKNLTGVDNRVIIENIRKLGDWLAGTDDGPDFIIRIPLLPEVNYDKKDFSKAAELLKDIRCIKYVEILPFHNLGEHKYKQLGYIYEFEGKNNLKPSDVQEYADIMKAAGLTVKVTDW